MNIEQVERARHLAHCFYVEAVWAMCKEELIPESEMHEGIRLAYIDKDLRQEMCEIFGRPEYGSWPLSSVDYRQKRFDEMNAKSLKLAAERDRLLKATREAA